MNISIFMSGKTFCLILSESIAVLKEYNILKYLVANIHVRRLYHIWGKKTKFCSRTTDVMQTDIFKNGIQY
jgi:hypothetical protein